jgi:hypothetical protein
MKQIWNRIPKPAKYVLYVILAMGAVSALVQLSQKLSG